jgi:hypothetical protein
MGNEFDYMGMLTKINDNLASLKDDMRGEIHAINLSVVAMLYAILLVWLIVTSIVVGYHYGR